MKKRTTDGNLTLEVARDLSPLSRRRFLKLGLIVSGAGLSTVIGSFYYFAGSNVPMPTPPSTIKNLSSEEYRLFLKIIEVLFPMSPPLPEAFRLPVIENIDSVIGNLPENIRADFSLGMKLFDKGSVIVGRHLKPFTDLSNEVAVQYIQTWHQGNLIQRSIVVAIKKIAYLSYWRNAETWVALDFEGPITKKYGIPSLGNAPLPMEKS